MYIGTKGLLTSYLFDDDTRSEPDNPAQLTALPGSGVAVIPTGEGGLQVGLRLVHCCVGTNYIHLGLRSEYRRSS